MRSKALLVGAKAGAIGPAVTLDEGLWEVESHPFVSVYCANESQMKVLPDRLRFRGVVRITTKVSVKYKGPRIYLDAKQVG